MMRRVGDALLAVAATLLVVGPLAHLAWHSPDHTHLPGGVVVRQGLQPHAHDTRHGHSHAESHGHWHDEGQASDHSHDDSSDDAPGDSPFHGAGSLAHFGGAPVLAVPVLVPPRLIRLVRLWVMTSPLAVASLRGRSVQSGWRARAPPNDRVREHSIV